MRRFYFLLAIPLLGMVGGNPATGQEGPVVERLIRWLQMTFGTIFATLGVVVLQWTTTIRRTTQVTERLEAHLAETEKDRLLTFQREEIELFKGRLEQALGREG